MRSSMTDKEWKDTEKKHQQTLTEKESTTFFKARARNLRHSV
jgi:NAD+--asparagine ADP-ribosyltransferase